MKNMSYCRFENTASDLQDCYDNMPNDHAELPSDHERRAYKRLIKLCKRISDDYGDEVEA